MYINFFKSAVSDNVDRIEVAPNTCIKDIEELKKIDFRHTLIYINGFQRDENYKLKKIDVCTIRYFPASGGGGGGGGSDNWVVDIIMNILTGGGYSTTKWVMEYTKNAINEALQGIAQIVDNSTHNTYVDNSYKDYSTHLTQNIVNVIQAQNAGKSPDMRGCPNKSGKDSPYPFVIGKSYFVPTYLGCPYITPADEYGTKQTYHVLYNLGYGKVNVSDIFLGLKPLATNVARQRNGEIVIDGFYNQSKYQIHLEIQESAEVSLYNQKVIQQDINTELVFPYDPTGQSQERLILDEISSLYPQKVEVEFYFDGLVGRTSDGKDCEGAVKLKVEYSLDGGNTFYPFAQVGNVSGSSYDSSTGETTLRMKMYHSMRLVATRVFSAGEVFNSTNHVVELRIQRTSVHKDDDFIYDTVSLASIRTYTYDPNLSSVTNLVPQSPVCEKDRLRLTRLGFTFTSDTVVANLEEFNCIVHALGRTCTENNGYYTWSGINELTETGNPASMALRALQSGMLGEYAYDDSEIDLQKFGELYKFCNEYDINDAQGNHVGLCANGVVTKQMKLTDLLGKILKVGRAWRIHKNGKVTLYIDKPIPYTSLILNNQNVLSASNTKSFDELPSGIKASFINEDNYNQDDVMYIDYDNAPPRSSSNYKTIAMSFEFQTNVEQIKKNGLYELAVMKLRPETWTRKVTSEGSLAYIGAKIEVQDDTIAVGIGDGAEIIDLVYDSNYIYGIKTDGTFDVTDTTQSYAVSIQCATLEYGIVIVTKRVTLSQAGVYKNFTFETPISLNELVLPTIGDIISFGIAGKTTYDSICTGKKGNGDGTFDLTLIPYVESIYNADGGQLPDFQSMTTSPSYFTPPRSKQNPTQEDLQNIKNNLIDIEQGNANVGKPDKPTDFVAVAEEDGIQLNWNPPINGGLKNSLKNYTIEISKDSGVNWNPCIELGTTEYLYRFDRSTEGYPESSDFITWKFRIKAVNIYDYESEYEEATIVTQYYQTWRPDTPVFIKKEADEGGINFAWESADGINNKHLYGYNIFELTLKYNGTIRKTIITRDLNAVYSFVRSVDHYPEKPDTPNLPQDTPTLNLYTVKLKVTNDSGNYAETSYQVISYTNYKTWIPPAISSVSREVVDRTVILTALYNTDTQFYGNLKTLVKIKRVGNLDTESGSTFNSILGITPDNVFYTPEFDKSVQTSETADNEGNYKKSTTTAFVSMGYKFSHTLPLIGQTYRIFKSGNVFTGVLTKDVVDYSSIPDSPTEGMVIRYTGTTIQHSGVTFSSGNYYLYESAWEQVFNRALIVPTTYMYSMQFTNESGNLSNLVDNIEATALCTNIADIVHSHEHYKDLYVEKLSAISANMGIVKQGGFGSFEELMNYWALSDLSESDSGIVGGIKKGAFRVGGADQYFKVTPIGNNQYDIELRAGNITLTTGGEGTTFKQGTYIYDNSDSTKRLALTANGIVAQKNTGTELAPNWGDIAQVRTDAVGNLIVTNKENLEETLPIGIQVNGDIYHFDSATHPDDEESDNPINPQGIVCTGEVKDTKDFTPILLSDSSKKCFNGTVEKDISQYNGSVVLFSKSESVLLRETIINSDGSTETGIETFDGYNEAMQETSTIDSTKTVGAYLGLTSEQVNNGIFY